MLAQLDTDYIKCRPGKIWPRLLAYALFEGRPLTTRGRWINPAVFASYRLIHALPLPAPDVAPIFIYGTGRAGTTALGKVLGLHSECGFLNEPKALWQAALGDDDLIGSYSTRLGRYRMNADDADTKKIRRLRRAYATFQRLSGSSRVVDKYPELIFRDGLVRMAFPKARKIILLRDGWQTAASVRAWSAEHGRPEDAADWWGKSGRKWHLLCRDILQPDPAFAAIAPHLGGITRQEDRAALEWVATMREALQLMRQADRKDLMFVRFEDLVTSPATEMGRIFGFAGLRRDDVALRYAEGHLQPQRPHPRPALHPEVEVLLAGTMQQLGYAPQEERN